MSPAAQGMDWQKVWLIVGVFFVGLVVFVSRKWMVGAESEAEQDRAFALREKRRREAKLAAALAAKRVGLGHRLMVLYRTGEWKRKSAA